MKCFNVNTILIALALVGLASSCKKEPKIGLPAPSKAILTVNVIPEGSTKAEVEATEFEKKTSTIQIGVFDRTSGVINAYRKLESGTSADFSVSKTEKTVIAVVNGPDISSATSVTEAKAIVAPFAAYNNESDGLVMYGTSPCFINSTSSCDVTVKRLVSKVSLVSVTNSLPAGYGTISIDYALVSNISDKCTLGGAEPDSHGWLNHLGVADAQPNVFCHKAYSGLTLANGASNSPSSVFYFYPCASNSASVRLVVAATISGKQYFYPISLGNNLAANTAYTVSLNIVGLGSDNPDVPVDKTALSVSVKVSKWTGGKNYNESI